MDRESQLLCRRFQDLARAAYHKGRNTYTDFLNLYEADLLYQKKPEFAGVNLSLFGGFTDAERKVACFSSVDTPAPLPEEYPICCLQIKPVAAKFQNALCHRDYLGAILNLGLERSKIGDIIKQGDSSVVFAAKDMERFLTEHLVRVHHTAVTCVPIPAAKFCFVPDWEEISATVSSLRLDAIIAAALHLSRSSSSGMIEGGKVFVNSRLETSNHYIVKKGDILSVRGYGRFIFQNTCSVTKKGRIHITVLQYK